LVLAYGSPQGLQGTATVGIISAIRTGWIQTDAQRYSSGGVQLVGLLRRVVDPTGTAINHGNSGGPLVDRRGRVLGITSVAFVGGGSGLGFAVDARKLCPLLAEMTGCE
jgi:S1-C subfamily serine protease